MIAILLMACVGRNPETSWSTGTTCERSPVRAQGCDAIWVCESGSHDVVWFTSGNEPDVICTDRSDRECMNASFSDAFGFSCRTARGVR